MDIEEDLKILQEFTELDRKLRNYKVESDYDNFCERRCVAIEHILAEREEDKKRIAELEAKLEFYQWGDLDNLKFEEYMKEFIPKQKVKDNFNKLITKIKEFENILVQIKLYTYLSNLKISYWRINNIVLNYGYNYSL